MKKDFVTFLELDSYSLKVGDVVNLTYNVATGKSITSFTSSDEKIAKVSADGVVTALCEGNVNIIVTVTCEDKTVVTHTYKFTISKENEDSPVILLNGVTLNVTINWNSYFDPLEGIMAIDNLDGDITNKIIVENKVNNRKYGTYDVIYKVTNSKGKTTTLIRKVTVAWLYNVKFVGHAGSYYGVANSLEAIRYALEELHYQAIEVDLKRTADGAFVLFHDDVFAGLNIAQTNYSDLLKVTVTQTRRSGYPASNGELTDSGKFGIYTSTICSLEEFLKLCKEYGAQAIIELKNCPGITKTDQSGMADLIKVIEDCEMLDQVIFLASNYHALIWTRNNGYTIPCQYLVNGCAHQEYLDRCIQYNFDLSLNVTYGEEVDFAWLAKYKEAGCKISVWTFSQNNDYLDVQKWIDYGADYITCDWHRIEKLNLNSRFIQK